MKYAIGREFTDSTFEVDESRTFSNKKDAIMSARVQAKAATPSITKRISIENLETGLTVHWFEVKEKSQG